MVILSIFSLITLIITFWTLNLGFTLRDEGWFLYLVKDQPSDISITRFYVFFDNLFNGNIYLQRLSVFFVDVLALIIFSLGLYSFFKRDLQLDIFEFFIILATAVLGVFAGHIAVSYVFSYITLNREIVLISLGLFFLALSIKDRISIVLLVLSGFTIGNLFFIMITNTLYILVLLIYLYIEHGGLKKVKLFTLGIVISFLNYFLFFQSIDSYLYDIHLNFNKAINGQFVTNHGFKYMILWIFDTIKYFVLEVFPIILIIYGMIFLKKSLPGTLQKIIYFVFLCFAFIYFWDYLLFPESKVVSMTPLLGFMFFVFIEVYNKRTDLKYSISIFLVVSMASVFLSFGSDTMFSVRTNYLVFILPVTFLLIQHFKGSRFYSSIYVGLLTLYFLVFLTFPFRTNWARVKYYEQNIPVSTLNINQNLKLDSLVIKEISQLKGMGLQGKDVILSSMYSWGYSYLLDCKPVIYDFNFDEKTASQKIKDMEIYKSIYLIEEKDSPHFSSFFKSFLYNEINAKSIVSMQTDVHNIYILEK